MWKHVRAEVPKQWTLKQAFRFWLMLQKNPKFKDVFDIAGHVLFETAVSSHGHPNESSPIAVTS